MQETYKNKHGQTVTIRGGKKAIKEIVNRPVVMHENICITVKALETADESLRQALKLGNAVDGIVIIDLIKRNIETLNAVKSFLNAKEEDA